MDKIAKNLSYYSFILDTETYVAVLETDDHENLYPVYITISARYVICGAFKSGGVNIT